MKIHLLAESSPNPVLTAVMEELARQHEVAVYDAETLPAGYGRGPACRSRRTSSCSSPARRRRGRSRGRRSAPAASS